MFFKPLHFYVNVCNDATSGEESGISILIVEPMQMPPSKLESLVEAELAFSANVAFKESSGTLQQWKKKQTIPPPQKSSMISRRKSQMRAKI